MAIQAQIHHDCSGLPPFIPLEFAGGGGGTVLMNPQRQQFLQNKLSNEAETPSFYSSQIDHFILSQSEKLKQVLREQMKRDVTELLKNIEARTLFLLDQKDEEISKAKTRTSQLESLLTKLQSDMLTWQHVAKQNELHVNSLNNTIELLQQQQQLNRPNEQLVEDKESCCEEQQQRQRRVDRMVCRVCVRREVRVVMLPCRHMCACRVCDPIIDSEERQP